MDIFERIDEFRSNFEYGMNEFLNKISDEINKPFNVPSATKKFNHMTDTGEDETNTWTNERWTDSTGMFKFYRKVVTSKVGQKVTKEDEVKEPTTDELRIQMDVYAKDQKYEKAAEIRDIINKRESTSK